MIAGCAACLALTGTLASSSITLAGERPIIKQTQRANASYATTNRSSSQPANAGYERRCVIMSCGTPWCYETRK
jgi:hypothetical protein